MIIPKFRPLRAFRRILFALTLACFALVFTGCPPTASDWKKVNFAISDVRFNGLKENQAQWSVVVRAINPGKKVLKMEGVHLLARLSGDTLGKLVNSQPLKLAARDTTTFDLNLVMPPKAWNKALKQMQRGGSSDVLITGDVFVKTWFGTRKVSNAINKKYTVNLAELMGTMGGDLLRNLFFR